MAEVAISRMIRAHAKNVPIGSGDGGKFVAFIVTVRKIWSN